MRGLAIRAKPTLKYVRAISFYRFIHHNIIPICNGDGPFHLVLPDACAHCMHGTLVHALVSFTLALRIALFASPIA